MNIYKFNDTKYDIKGTPYYNLYQYFDNGGDYKGSEGVAKYTVTRGDGTSAEFTRLSEELFNNGYKRVMGWIIDFRLIWSKYLVNIKYYGWTEVYAPSKMAIRDVYGNNNILDKIIEL